MPSAPKLTAIYGLFDPRTGAIRYIGKSVKPGIRAQTPQPDLRPLLCLKAVRRKIQREGNRADLKRFDLNAHSHIVLGVVRDFPVLPFYPAYDHCWHPRAH